MVHFLKVHCKICVKHIKVFHLEFGFKIILCIICPLLLEGFHPDDRPTAEDIFDKVGLSCPVHPLYIFSPGLPPFRL